MTESLPSTQQQLRPCGAADFAGRVVLVTGAGSGMGRQTALAFAGCDAELVLADRDANGLGEVASILPQARPVIADVSDPDSVAALYSTIDEHYGRIDHVAHCAAVISATPFLNNDAGHWRQVLDINLVGTFVVTQEAVRRMSAAGEGTIVLVASDAGVRGGGGLIADAPYAASKAGVLSLVKSVAREFAGSGFRINAVVPGPSDTPMHDRIDTDTKQRIASGIPLGRMGHPDDMAAAIVFLSSTAASFIYGAALDADGGAMLR